MVANPDSTVTHLTDAQHVFIHLHAAMEAVAAVAGARALDPTAFPHAGFDFIPGFARVAFESLVEAGFEPDGIEGDWSRYATRTGRLA